MSSQIFSSVVIQLTARWQFWSTTHEPLDCASMMSFFAMGPCPWPSEMEFVRLPPKPRASPNLSSCDIGSWPGERMKMSGTMHVESLKHSSRLNGGGSTNFCSMFSETKAVTMGTTRSGRRQRRMQHRSKGTPSSFRSESHLPGSACLWGTSASYTIFHSLSCLPKSEGKSAKPGSSERRRISSHRGCASQGAPSDVEPSAVGFLGALSEMMPVPPVRKKVNWPASSLLSPRMMLVHMTKEKSSLSFS